MNFLSKIFASVSLVFGSLLVALPAIAQVTSDGTTSTTVNADGNNFTIEQGDRAGSNLFHSFKDFSVPTGGQASFNNAADIVNILSRVTGGNISNINGLLKANGGANLFLINPAGIIFGEGASLDIGGSFYGSSADSILFEDGEFSATDLNNPPVLTINAPIGLGFRDNPGDVANSSVANDGNGLEVATGNNITLLGGNISFNGGSIFAPGGIVNLGGLTAAGTVSFTDDGSLNFPESIARGDVSLANSAVVSVLSGGGGSIFVNARNLDLTSLSRILAGIGDGLGSVDAQAGDVVINATESVTLDGASADGNFRSGIFNIVAPGAVGNGGALNITTANLALTNGGGISTSTGGEGDGGSISIDATKSIALDKESIIGSLVFPGVVGNGGALNITTPNLALTNGGQINSSTFGEGDSGSISIDATESITLDGISVIRNAVGTDAVGNAGELNITTPNLTLINGSQINSGTEGQGDGGTLNIDATESLTVDGTSTDGNFRSAIFNNVGTDAVGNAGALNITTSNLALTNGGGIFASTLGEGDGGTLNIDATKSVSLDGISTNGNFSSGVFNTVVEGAEGNGGALNITTSNLALTNGGQINASTFGKGNAGNITINATDISFDGVDSNGFASRAVNNVEAGAVGNGGALNITTANLTLTNRGGISASTGGEGDGGRISIDATESVTLDGASGIANVVAPGAVGNGGALNITTPNLAVTNGSGILASTLEGAGDGGAITLTTTDLVLTNGSFIDASNLLGVGNGGSVFVKADTLSLNNGTISAVNAPSESPTENAAPKVGGNISLEIAKNLFLRNDSTITAEAGSNATGGNVDINTDFIVAFPEGNNDIRANAIQGQGGNINITAEGVFGIEERPLNDSTNDINASSELSLDGTVSITILEPDTIRGTAELPINVIELQQTTEQACGVDPETGGANGLTVKGKGGVPPAPDLPLNSQAIMFNGKDVTTQTNQAQYPEIKPIPTSYGDIIPAQGVIVTKDGRVILTAYRTDGNARVPQGSGNCGR